MLWAVSPFGRRVAATTPGRIQSAMPSVVAPPGPTIVVVIVVVIRRIRALLLELRRNRPVRIAAPVADIEIGAVAAPHGATAPGVLVTVLAASLKLRGDGSAGVAPPIADIEIGPMAATDGSSAARVANSEALLKLWRDGATRIATSIADIEIGSMAATDGPPVLHRFDRRTGHHFHARAELSRKDCSCDTQDHRPSSACRNARALRGQRQFRPPGCAALRWWLCISEPG